MIPICRVCLRTDLQLLCIDESLCSLFDELCDYEGADSYAKFCTACIYELRKFHKFKEKCQLATKTLQEWKKQKRPVREALSTLSAKMVPSRLSLCNRNNLKLYFYEACQLNKVSTTEISNPEFPHIITLSVPNKESHRKTLKHERSLNVRNKPESITEPDIKSNVSNECEAIIEPPSNSSVNVKCEPIAGVTIKPNECESIIETVFKSNSNECESITEPDLNPNVYECQITAEIVKVKAEDNVEAQNTIDDDDINDAWSFEEVQLDNLIDPDMFDVKKSIVCKKDKRKHNATDKTDTKHNFVKENNGDFNVDQLISSADIKAAESSEDEIITLTKFKKSKKSGTKKNIAKKSVARKRKMTLAELANLDLEVDEGSDKKDLIVLKKRGRKISLEELRRRLVKQFTHCGEVKDEDGNVIDSNVILDNLDSMPVPTLRQLKNQVSAGNGIKVLTPASIKLLAQLQKKYSNEYSNAFTVEHLGTRQQILEEFAQRQHYESYSTAQYKCEECYTAFKSHKTLMYHKKACHNEKDQHVCTICSVRYNKEASLKWHYFSHRTVYKCKLCPFVTYQKHTMMLHYNIHAGVSYNCKNCEATFKSRSGLYLHMNTAHKTKYECSTCGRGFSTEYGLKVHQYMAHQEGELETSTCDICDKTFDNYEKYKRHVSYLHSEQIHDMLKPRKEKVERLKGERKYGVPNMFCPVCKKQLNSVGAMRWHFKVDHPNESFEVQYSGTHRHLCHECGKGFHALSELNDHKNLHTGAKPYSCTQCSATFYRKRNMTLHVLRHNPPSKECTLCDKKFRSGSNLYNHMRTHSGDRRYKCGICPKAFLHASALSAHTRGVHNHIRRIKKKANTPPLYE